MQSDSIGTTTEISLSMRDSGQWLSIDIDTESRFWCSIEFLESKKQSIFKHPDTCNPIGNIDCALHTKMNFVK